VATRPRPASSTHRLLDADGSEREVVGQLLGFSSSQRPYHNHPDPRDMRQYPEEWKCSACRWFEVTIIYVPADETYAVYTVGRSALNGEQPRPRIQFTQSPHEIIEMLTDRRRRHATDAEAGSSQPRLPVAAAHCLAQAAAVDPDIEDAYVNRAVV
jgi:hypothetical protein